MPLYHVTSSTWSVECWRELRLWVVSWLSSLLLHLSSSNKNCLGLGWWWWMRFVLFLLVAKDATAMKPAKAKAPPNMKSPAIPLSPPIVKLLNGMIFLFLCLFVLSSSISILFCFLKVRSKAKGYWSFVCLMINLRRLSHLMMQSETEAGLNSVHGIYISFPRQEESVEVTLARHVLSYGPCFVRPNHFWIHNIWPLARTC